MSVKDLNDNQDVKRDRTQSITLVYAAFIAGLCSIIYELLIATTVSYFLGDSVKYFSITIGLYMAAMGAGSYFSKFVTQDLLQKFIIAEILLGLLGGLSVPLLYFSYSDTELFIPVYAFLTLSIGFIIGLEIPFLTRLMEQYHSLKVNIANVLSFDYLGALIATVAFPFFLLPFFGTFQSSLIFGLVNMSIAIVVLLVFKNTQIVRINAIVLYTALSCVIIISALFMSEAVLQKWEQNLYKGRIVHSEQSPYQHIVLTKNKEDVRLYLDGNIQFSSTDEYRYHESLVYIPVLHSPNPVKRVLVLGAGDGLAVKELLKFEEIEEITLVDLDERIVELANSNPYLVALNQNSLLNQKVTWLNGDAFTYLQQNRRLFDVIIIDLPDPNNISLARLYSKQFYSLVKTNLTLDGIMVTQATSPYFALEAFWSIAKTVKAAGLPHVYPYHLNVPSFGDWGFVMSSSVPLTLSDRAIPEARFLSSENLPSLFIFDKDIRPTEVEINRLDKPILLNYYLNGWRYFKT